MLGRPGVFAPQSLGWRGEPGSVGSRRWVWAASSLVHEARVGPQRLTSPLGGPGAAKEVGWRPVREQEPADALGMPPAPLPPAMQFFIVGGLAVPPPLPADRSSGLEAWPQLSGAARTGPPPCPPAVGQGPGLSSWSAPPLLPRGQERETPPSPAGSKPQGALEGAPWAGGGCPHSWCPGMPRPQGLCFLSLQQACHQLGPWGAALGHSSIATCGAGPGPWNPGQASVTRLR